jgi:hypothetical protein
MEPTRGKSGEGELRGIAVRQVLDQKRDSGGARGELASLIRTVGQSSSRCEKSFFFIP